MKYLMKYVLFQAMVKIVFFQVQNNLLALCWFGLGFLEIFLLYFEIVLMKGSNECYCEEVIVEVFMKVLLVHLDWIHVVPQVPSHLGEMHKGDIEDGVQGVQADAGYSQIHGVEQPGSVSVDIAIEESDNLIKFHGRIIYISH